MHNTQSIDEGLFKGFAPADAHLLHKWLQFYTSATYPTQGHSMCFEIERRSRDVQNRRLSSFAPSAAYASASNLRYAMALAEDFLRWMKRECMYCSRLRDPTQCTCDGYATCWSCMRLYVSGVDSHDSMATAIRPGDIVDGLLLQGQLGLYNMTHNALYLGGGFVAHVVVPRRAHMALHDRGMWGTLAAAFKIEEYCCLFMISKIYDMSTYGFVLNHTAASADGRLRRTCHFDVDSFRGIDVVPDLDERVIRILTAVRCMGTYPYHLVSSNCQHFENAICGSGFISQGSDDTLRAMAALAFLILMCLLVFLMSRGANARSQR